MIETHHGVDRDTVTVTCTERTKSRIEPKRIRILLLTVSIARFKVFGVTVTVIANHHAGGGSLVPSDRPRGLLPVLPLSVRSR
jgi:hypothetical protein